MNCYNVVRFNGPNQDCDMKSHLDYESAKKISEYLNGINKKPEIRYRVIEYLVPMTREELFAKYENCICELCKLNGHYKSTPSGITCEGNWCDESSDEFAYENNIEITN